MSNLEEAPGLAMCHIHVNMQPTVLSRTEGGQNLVQFSILFPTAVSQIPPGSQQAGHKGSNSPPGIVSCSHWHTASEYGGSIIAIQKIIAYKMQGQLCCISPQGHLGQPLI